MPKPEEYFAVNRARETGRQAMCRACMKAYRVKVGKAREPGWERKTRDIVAYRKEYRKANKERLAEWEKKSRMKNPEYWRLKARKKYEKKQRAIYGPDWVSSAKGHKSWNKLPDEERRRRANARGRLKYRRFKLDHPDRYAAKVALKREVKARRIISLPCWECGGLKTEAHHPVYSLPLDVVWLCRKHHRQLHREFNVDRIGQGE